MNINDKLKQLYESHWDGFIEQGKKLTTCIPTNPMLLKLNEDYFSTETKRIIICGQETWGWENFGTSIDHCMLVYWKFFVEKEFYEGYGKSAFWKAFRFFEEKFKLSLGEKNCTFIYQNLSKVGLNNGETGITDEIRQLERKFFPVLRDEFKIINPDIVLFLTGPNRDSDIKFHFPDAEFIPTDDETNLRQKAKIRSKDLPLNSFRLYHPSYYRAFTNNYKSSVINNIIKDMNQNM
mgnify:CR=1 FL=1